MNSWNIHLPRDQDTSITVYQRCLRISLEVLALSPESKKSFQFQHLCGVRGEHLLIGHLLDRFERALVSLFKLWIFVSLIIHQISLLPPCVFSYFFPLSPSFLLRENTWNAPRLYRNQRGFLAIQLRIGAGPLIHAWRALIFPISSPPHHSLDEDHLSPVSCE